uniref:Major facilitator superfamily (MFS) profile domain-containing protein n=1 Tax=Strigamia maritima TaxID=126957 RepID=T1J286_STRMM
MLKTNNQVQESVTGINNGIDNPTFQNEENYNFVKENAVKTTADEANELNKEKRRIWKSLACLFLTVMLSYSSSITLYNSLTSLFPNDNFGISVLSILASSQVVGAASASVCLKIWGCLKMLRIGLLTGVVFIIAFFYPTWITLTIGGIAAGFSFAMIYAAGYTYANSVGYWLAHITNNGNSLDAILVRVTGIMNASQMGGFIWGNLFLYYIFGSSPKVDVRSSEELCGAAYCNQELNVTTLQPPSPHSYYTLIGILTAMSVTACATSYFLEDFSSRLGHKCRSIKEICTVFLDFLRLFKNPKGFLLAPLTIAISMEESFLLGDATIV